MLRLASTRVSFFGLNIHTLPYNFSGCRPMALVETIFISRDFACIARNLYLLQSMQETRPGNLDALVIFCARPWEQSCQNFVCALINVDFFSLGLICRFRRVDSTVRFLCRLLVTADLAYQWCMSPTNHRRSNSSRLDLFFQLHNVDLCASLASPGKLWHIGAHVSQYRCLPG